MEKNQVIHRQKVNNCVALFDEQFLISDLSSSFIQSEAKADGIITQTKDIIHKVLTKEEKNDEKYVVQISDEVKAKIDAGEIRFVRNKAGELLAQTRNAKGQFQKRLPIKKELQKQGISNNELEMALQMEAIKGQLENIVGNLKSVEEQLQDVVNGQRGDRIGLYYSGFSLYLEARELQNHEFKSEIISQALKSLSDANSQVVQDLRNNLEYLINHEYEKGRDKVQAIDEHVSAIKQCYDIITKSYFVKAMIYQENQELQAMLTTIQEYGKFIEMMIIPYIGELHEYDMGSKALDGSSWTNIAHSLSGCEDLKKLLLSNNNYILSQEGVKYED